MNKSTELCLHNCKKTNLQYCKGESTIFKFYHLFFGNCNRLLFHGRLHFIDKKAKVNAEYYVESFLPSLVPDCFQVASPFSKTRCSHTHHMIDTDVDCRQLSKVWGAMLDLYQKYQPPATSDKYFWVKSSSSVDLEWLATASHWQSHSEFHQAIKSVHQS